MTIEEFFDDWEKFLTTYRKRTGTIDDRLAVELYGIWFKSKSGVQAPAPFPSPVPAPLYGPPSTTSGTPQPVGRGDQQVDVKVDPTNPPTDRQVNAINNYLSAGYLLPSEIPPVLNKSVASTLIGAASDRRRRNYKPPRPF